MTAEAPPSIPAIGLDRPAGTANGPGSAARTAAARTFARPVGIGALIAVAGTILIFAALHVLPPTSRISPVTRTISEYGLTTSAWAFDLGVVLLALASVAVFGGLALLGHFRISRSATISGALWVAGLLTLVTFPKHNWALGADSASGQIHRLASLVAFVALPIAVISIARRRGRASYPAAARWAFWLGTLAPVWFLPMLIAIVAQPLTGTPWWQAIPLGLVERGLALTEVLAVAALAVLLTTSGRATQRQDAAQRLSSAHQLTAAPLPPR